MDFVSYLRSFTIDAETPPPPLNRAHILPHLLLPRKRSIPLYRYVMQQHDWMDLYDIALILDQTHGSVYRVVHGTLWKGGLVERRSVQNPESKQMRWEYRWLNEEPEWLQELLKQTESL